LFDLVKGYRYLLNTPERLLVNFDLLFDGFGFRRSASFAAGEAGFQVRENRLCAGNVVLSRPMFRISLLPLQKHHI
jgi:hypothetical protein